MDYLEQLLTEWYEYQGYFVRRDLWVGLDWDGSYECELDVVAFHPAKNHILQIEPSVDILPWKDREEHFRTKFDAGRKYLHRMTGFRAPAKLDQIALLVFDDKVHHRQIAGGRVVLLSEFLAEILVALAPLSPATHTGPDQWPLLRTLHFVAQYREQLCSALLNQSAS